MFINTDTMQEESTAIVVRLKYYDTNGHNFGVESPVLDRKNVKKVITHLPGTQSPEVLKAIAAYRNTKRATIRSAKIDKWLRLNSHVGQEFSAKLRISENGEEHYYFDLTPIWLTR